MINETEEKKPNYIILIIILVLFLITLGILVYYIRFQTTTAPKASGYNTVKTVSIVNSYVFASPVRAKAGGDLIRVTVFILDGEGNGIFDQNVSITTTSSDLDVNEIQRLTDDTGRAIFDISSNAIGSYLLSVSSNGVSLPQTLKVSFD